MVDMSQDKRWTWAIVLLAGLVGTIVRWCYVDGTPADLRAHDFQGHMDYLAFVLEHGRMPSHSQGFQGYQPPLYYFLAAPLAAPAEPGGPLSVAPLQQLSLWISLLTLGAGLWMGGLLFGGRRGALLLFSLALACFPGLVMGASRVTNDGLVQLLIFAAMGLMILWWQTGQDRWWMLAAGITGLGVLTKANALMLLPIAGGLLWMRSGLARKTQLRLLAFGAGIVAAVSGWLIAVRLVVDQTPSVVPNTSYLPPELRLTTGVEDLLVFNPVRLLQHPFGNRLESLQQIQGFWEFYFRSAFFGEFPFDPGLRDLAWLILLLALLLLPVLGFGLWRALRHARTEMAHLWLPLLSLLGIHAVYRLIAPFTPSQDFRYTSLALVPALALMLEGAAALPTGLRRVVWLVLLVLSGLCAGFLLQVV